MCSESEYQRANVVRFCYEAMCFDNGVFGLNNWCSEREYQRGDEIAWYADGDKIVRNEFNLATAYAFGKLPCLLILLFI